MFKYFGTDWLAMGLTFIAIHMIGNKQRYGFIFMMTANCVWLVVGILTSSIALIIANIVFSAMNLRAFIKWSTGK
jgi:hypothetical protein